MFSLFSGERTALSYSLILYFFTLFILFNIKPSYAYTKDGKMKQWGIGSEKILFPLYLIAMVISVFGLFIFNIKYS